MRSSKRCLKLFSNTETSRCSTIICWVCEGQNGGASWILGAFWSMGIPKFVVTYSKDHLPLLPKFLAATCSSPSCWSGKNFGMGSTSRAWEESTKEQPSSSLKPSNIFSEAGEGSAARLHTCINEPGHVTHWTVSSLTWGGYTPVPGKHICLHHEPNFSFRERTEFQLQVTGSNCTSGPRWAPMAGKGDIFPHLCVSYASQKGIKHILNIITTLKQLIGIILEAVCHCEGSCYVWWGSGASWFFSLRSTGA
jgi:hypothetical protein